MSNFRCPRLGGHDSFRHSVTRPARVPSKRIEQPLTPVENRIAVLDRRSTYSLADRLHRHRYDGPYYNADYTGGLRWVFGK